MNLLRKMQLKWLAVFLVLNIQIFSATNWQTIAVFVATNVDGYSSTVVSGTNGICLICHDTNTAWRMHTELQERKILLEEVAEYKAAAIDRSNIDTATQAVQKQKTESPMRIRVRAFFGGFTAGSFLSVLGLFFSFLKFGLL